MTENIEEAIYGMENIVNVFVKFDRKQIDSNVRAILLLFCVFADPSLLLYVLIRNWIFAHMS